MYHEAGIQALSKKQISRLLNGHPVRIKHGSHHKIHLSADHHKKLHRAHAKGSALTVTLDPFAIQHNQHLRDAVGMARKLTGTGPKGLKKFVKTTNALGHVIKSVGDYISTRCQASYFRCREPWNDESWYGSCRRYLRKTSSPTSWI